MSQPLPHSDLRFCDEAELEALRRSFRENGGNDFSMDDETGFVLEVDLDYPHDDPIAMARFQQFPPLCEPRVVGANELSPHTLALEKQYQLAPNRAKSLINDLHDKRDFKIHIMNLKKVLSLGLRLRRIIRAACFKQSRWLKSYIEFNQLQV